MSAGAPSAISNRPRTTRWSSRRPSLNRVQLYDLSNTNAAVSLGSSTQSGIGPHALASLASPFGSPPPPFSTLLIASSLNDPPPERLDIVTNFPIGFASSAGQFPETGSFERANALPIFTNGPTLCRRHGARPTNDALHLWQFTNSPAVFLAFSNLPPGSDYVFGNFNGESLPRFIFYQPGGIKPDDLSAAPNQRRFQLRHATDW